MKKLLSLGALLLALTLLPFQSQAQRRKSKAAAAPDAALYSGLEYRELGPFRGGRSAAVTGVPGQPNLFYMGATGGGVWKTTDAGTSWENISDGFFGGSIGAVAVAPSDHNTIYVGGGEVTLRGNVSSGYGMFKSEDAGKTWASIGLPESRHIPRIRIDPNNPDIVYAAVLGNIYMPTQERGVYKSTNGGKSWRKTLFANENAGAVDLVIDPNNAKVLYATTWRVNRTPYSLNSGGEGSKVWKSTDAGEHWTEISTNKGFAKGTLGIMGIAVSPVQADRVWAMVENKDQGGLYRSDNGGESWTKINDERKLRQRAWYYTRLYADTQDANGLYVLNVRYHKSTDGGKSFSTFNAPHGDHHDLWIAPEDNQRMIMADDGGAQVSLNGGGTWSTYQNQPTAQYYRVTTDNSFPYRIYVAQQDNSTQRVKHRSDGYAITEDDWEETAGGESAHIAVDPLNNDIVYGGSYGGFLTRVNHQTGTTRGINVWPDNPMGYGAEGMKYRFQWNFPIIFSKHNPKKLYTFSQHVHATTNEGQSWEILSPDLSRNEPSKLVSSGGPITQDNTGVEYYATIFAAGESPLKEGLLWTGSDDGLVHLTKDGGANWSNVTPKQMPTWAMVNSVEPSAFDPAVCYIAATSYKSGDFTPYLYKTSDYGATWTTITKGIDSEHFTRVLREDPKRQGLLYAGTETGMYISFNDGASWEPFQQNLPIVPITDLAIKDNNLIVATQGRSLWIIDDLNPLQGLSATASTKVAHLFAPKDAYRTKGGANSRKNLLAGTNHPAGVVTHFYLPPGAAQDSVALDFSDSSGALVASFSNKATEKDQKMTLKDGGNSFVWDTRGAGAEKLPGMILWWANLDGPKAVPGDYSVAMSINGQPVGSHDFKILPDPRAEASVADMQAQYDFITAVNGKVQEAHDAIKNIRSVTEKLDAFTALYKEDASLADLLAQAKELKEGLSVVEKALYQTQNRSGQDPLNFPIRLTNKLGHLNSLVGLDDFAPTAQDQAVRAQLTAAIDVQLSAYKTLVGADLDAFNKAFNQKQLPFLKVDPSK
ncbi:MAG: glycosyl hydrolase [Flavobacteriia bacterium]|nr:glycosyl hydrolase [Flavobacteriia bacterium]